MKKFAQIVSIFGHPFVTLTVFMLYVMFQSGKLADNYPVFLSVIGGVLVPVVVYLFVKSRNGSFTNFDVSDRHQRKSFYRFAVPLLAIVTVVLFVTRQPSSISLPILFALILFALAQVVNHYVKSSLHVSFNIYLTALILMQNPAAALVALLLTALVGWSRVKLGRHTLKEVLYGFVLGSVVSGAMIYFIS